MDLEGMQVFVAIADCGTLTAAASKLGITKSTVSRRLAEYEYRVGASLFRRSTRNLSLTDIGKQHYTRVRELIHDAENALADIVNLSAEPKGLLRISASIQGAQAVLAPMLWRFKRHYPQVQLELIITDQNVDLIRDGIDFTVRMGDLEDSDLLVRKLATGYRAIVASPDFLSAHFVPRTMADLKRLPTVVTQPNQHVWRFASGESVSVAWTISAGTIALALDACLQGFGIALLPELACQAQIEQGQLVRLLPDHALKPVDISLVYPRLQYQSPAARAFLNQLTLDT